MLKSTSFIFDGVSSETYGLMIYFMDDESTKELSLGTDVDMIEDRLPKRISPIHYGVDINKAMTFPLTFGSTEYLEDYDVDAILSWLTGHQQYKWLEFVDGDHYVRYKCHLNNMKSIYINGLPVAFTCDVECDSQFGYEYPVVTNYSVNSSGIAIDYYNRSSYNGYIYPELRVDFENDCNSLSIINESDNNREFKINYFDREVINTTNAEYIYETTLATEISNDTGLSNDLITWTISSIDSQYDYNEIIVGDEVWVALPSRSDIALYSEDNGDSWIETPLPYSGSWTGCYGNNGFVAVCIDDNTAVSTYSEDGRIWSSIIVDLPINQNWNKVKYINNLGAISNQYIALGGPNSSIAAISSTGLSWTSVYLPRSQEWRDVFSGNGKVVAVGGNSNYIAISNDCIDWEEIELPISATWNTGCYGNDKYIILADTLYGNGSRDPIAIESVNGKDWTSFSFPIGAWKTMLYEDNKYIAIGERQFIFSTDGIKWYNTTIPLSATSISIFNSNKYLCAVGTNKYLISSDAETVEGKFNIELASDDGIIIDKIDNIYIYANISDTVGDSSYASNGEKLLATNIDNVSSGGDIVPITSDLRYGVSIDGVMMSAIYDDISGIITVSFIVDTSHTSLLAAPLNIRISYDEDISSDLGYDGLIVNVDNKNQIITTNKENLNLYEYFNNKFFRLVKGMNHLVFKTDGGSCSVTMNCEFLRKVGGK